MRRVLVMLGPDLLALAGIACGITVLIVLGWIAGRMYEHEDAYDEGFHAAARKAERLMALREQSIRSEYERRGRVA